MNAPGARDADGPKRAAAALAVSLIEDGMLLGLGTGSTMVFVVDLLAERIRKEGLRVQGVPTSIRTETQARSLGVPLTDLASVSALDMAIDGADEVEVGTLNLIKGLGGALLREKIVAQAAPRFVVVADPSKVVRILGERVPVPVEVIPFSHEMTARRLAALGGKAVLRPGKDGAPFVSDNGNLIYDCHFGPMADPAGRMSAMRDIAGVVESGLFLACSERAIIGQPDGTASVMTADWTRERGVTPV